MQGWVGIGPWAGVEGVALQPLLKARVQGIEINVFDGQPVGPAIRAVLPAAAFGLADAPPVGGLVATAGKTVALDKGFQQIDGMAVFALPIAAQPPSNAAQQMAGQRGDRKSTRLN